MGSADAEISRRSGSSAPAGPNTERDETLADGRVSAVHRHLREAILRGHVAPGRQLSQVALAEELGVSRTPLREALRMLIHEGLLRSELNRGIHVVELSAEDLEGLYVVRINLEAAAIRITIPLLEPEDLAGMEGQLAQMAHFAAAHDYARWEVPHRAFHRGLVSKSPPRLIGTLDQLFDHAERYRRLYTTTQPLRGWDAGILEHRAILDACERGEQREGAISLATHLGHTAFGVLARIEPGYDPASLRVTLLSLGVDPEAVKAGAW
jgi:DNA-binding GntR family transcriptional regulator